MTRARRRKARTMTADAEWLRRREDVLAVWRGDDLADCAEFWQREPDVRAELRADEPGPYSHLLATDIPHPDIEAEIKARRDQLVARRLDWLAKAGYR
jgi:hypothetical protein